MRQASVEVFETRTVKSSDGKASATTGKLLGVYQCSGETIDSLREQARAFAESIVGKRPMSINMGVEQKSGRLPIFISVRALTKE